MLLGAVGENFECCKFIICLIGIECVYVFFSLLNDINECNVECVFDSLTDMIIFFGWDGV